MMVCSSPEALRVWSLDIMMLFTVRLLVRWENTRAVREIDDVATIYLPNILYDAVVPASAAVTMMRALSQDAKQRDAL